MTDREIEVSYPSVPWRKPVMVRGLQRKDFGFACRLCIAHKGLKAEDQLFDKLEEAQKHIDNEHKE